MNKRRNSAIPKLIFSKNPDIDYNLSPLIDFVEKFEDPFSGYIILHSFKL